MSSENIDDITAMDPIRLHAQEPAEGDVDPGEVTPGMPHAEEPAEGDIDPGEVTPEPPV